MTQVILEGCKNWYLYNDDDSCFALTGTEVMKYEVYTVYSMTTGE